MRTVVAMFDRFEDAQSAVRALHDSGFNREEINLVANDASGEYSKGLGTTKTTEGEAGSGAAAGAGIGAVLGGLGGLLVGLGALAIPGIGPVLAAGPIVAALAGAGVGAVAGGLIGALVDLGVPEEHAEYYAEGIRRGATLVTVRTDDNMAEEARMLLNNFNPVDIQTRSQTWRDEGWQGYRGQEMPTSDVRSGDYSYNRSAGVPVTGSDMHDDDVLNDPTMSRDTGDIGVTGMPIDRNRDRDRDYGTGGSEGTTFRREDEKRDELRGWNRDSEKMEDEDSTFGIGPASDIDRNTGSIHNRDLTSMGSSNIPVTGSDQNFNDDDDVEDADDINRMSDHLREDVFGRDRAGTGTNDIPVTGGTRDMADMETAEMETMETGTNTWDGYNRSFQSDYQTRYGVTSYGYDYYQPAYRYGYDLANDPRYRNADWDSFEIDARNDWEMRGSQGAWEDVKDAVRHAWRSVTGR